MPDPDTDKSHPGVYCDAACHNIKPLYGPVVAKVRKPNSKTANTAEAAVHLK